VSDADNRLFYGWVVLATLSLVYFLMIGTIFYGFGVVLAPMTKALGWSRAEAALGFSIMGLGSGLFGPPVALLIHRIGTRATIFAGGFVSAAGALLTWHSSSLATFYCGAGLLLGLGMCMQTVIPGTHVLNHWFHRRRALAVGVFLTSGGIGAFVAAPALNALIALTGSWRTPWLVMAAGSMAAALLALALIREWPSQLGQHPDGDPVAPVDEDEEEQDLTPSGAVAPSSWPGRVYRTRVHWGVREALATPTFWAVVFAVAMSVQGLQIVDSQAVLHLTDIGVSTTLAAAALGMQGLVSAAGRLCAGTLGDRIDPRYLLAAGLASELAGVAVLSFATTPLPVYAFAVLFGLGWGLAFVSGPTLLANLFGSENYASLFGIQSAVVTCVAAAGPFLSGVVDDATGSYVGAFLAYSALALVAAGVIAGLRTPRPVAAERC